MSWKCGLLIGVDANLVKRAPSLSCIHASQGLPGNSNWKNEETDSSENIDHPGLSSVTDGLVNSLASTSTPRFRVTETPGPREKEIVELFRKIQEQLRERSIIKEKKSLKSTQGKFQENGTVDSLIELLRKHSSKQRFRKFNGHASSILDTGNHSVQDGDPNGLKNTGFPKVNNRTSYESKEHNASSSTRSVSYSRRSSTISQTKTAPPPAYRRRNAADMKPYIRNKSVASPPEPALAQGPDLATHPQLDHERESDPVFHEVSDEALAAEEEIETHELSTLKLVDLRQMARSRGVKGFSKLKKSELVELLCESSL
uniref:Rho termination factor-like N-terminal domain-containing protein n=1 Tax=Kalanchoe fedtschenkoi TaxID=63787 RepID=A0A7N0V710_KALFE